MVCFEIAINTKRVSTAAVGEYGVLTAGLHWARSRDGLLAKSKSIDDASITIFQVGGIVTHIDNRPDEFVDWIDETLVIGDMITIKVIADSQVDDPINRELAGPERDLETRRNLYEAYKYEFEGESDSHNEEPDMFSQGTISHGTVCFEVELNGMDACIAGVGELGVLSVTLVWTRNYKHLPGEESTTIDTPMLSVSALTSEASSDSEEYVEWMRKPLKVGDQVTIRVVAAAQYDEPVQRRRKNPNLDHENSERRREGYEELKREFGSSSKNEPPS